MFDKLDDENMKICADRWASTLRTLPKNPITVQPYDGSEPRTRNLPPLSPENYVTRSTLLQDSEYHARAVALQNSALYGVKLSPVSEKPQYSPAYAALYTIEAPHIRENYPPVSIFDTVWLRQLRPWSNSLQGYVFEARVHSIQRRWGIITIQCDALAEDGMWESGLFNLEFVPQSRQFTLCRYAMESMYHDIGEPQRANLMRPLPARWIFPDPADLASPAASGPPNPMNWVDVQLNLEQKVLQCILRYNISRVDMLTHPQLAVESIVHGGHGVPYLISGPPGTGCSFPFIYSCNYEIW